MGSMVKKCFVMVVMCMMFTAVVCGCRKMADSMKPTGNMDVSGKVSEEAYVTTTTTAYMDAAVETTTGVHKESIEPESTYAVENPTTTTTKPEESTTTIVPNLTTSEPTVAETPVETQTIAPTEPWTDVWTPTLEPSSEAKDESTAAPVTQETTTEEIATEEVATMETNATVEVPVTTVPMESETTTEESAAIEPTADISKADEEKKTSGLGYHGALSVRNGKLVDSDGEVVILRGISTMGLQWYGQYVSKETLEFLKNTSGMNVIRLAMYTAEGGYCHKDANGKAELEALIDKGVQAATELDMYVIIDWHILSDGNPNTYKEEAKTFFDKMSKKYADYDNVIYEICNEPNGNVSWKKIKNYANEVIPVIRNNDSDAIVLVGTPTWSQEIDKAMADPLKFDNIMYTLHFYADTHRDYLRDRLKTALDAKIPVFVSEFGICDASGNGAINEYEAGKWTELMEQYDISWCIWNLSNKNEASALIASWCDKLCDWAYDEWSQSGKWFLKIMEKYK